MEKVRFAVVGVGGLGKSHIRGIHNNSDMAELVCVCDNREEIAKAVAEANNVPYYVDFYEMIKDGGFDCIILVTPDQIHREHAVAALEAGYHVLCEKPLAQTMDDCEAMVAAARRSGKKFMTGQVCRKAPGFMKAKELVDAGEIGELFFVESEYAHDYQFMKPEWRRDPVNLRYSIVGGGCHAIDLLRWIAGNPTKVMALANRKVLTDWPVDDCTIAIQLVLHVLTQLQVEGGQRLVQKKDLGLVDKGTCDSNALLLTAREIVDVLALKSLEIYKGKHFLDSCADLLILHLLYAKAECDVLVNVQMGEESISLKDGVDVTLVGGDVVDALTVKNDLALIGRLKAADNAKRGGFSTAGGTKQGNEFLVMDIQINGLQYLFSVIFLADTLQFDELFSVHFA